MCIHTAEELFYTTWSTSRRITCLFCVAILQRSSIANLLRDYKDLLRKKDKLRESFFADDSSGIILIIIKQQQQKKKEKKKQKKKKTTTTKKNQKNILLLWASE